MNLDHFLAKDQVVQIKSTEKQHVIRELATTLAELGHIENSERFYPQIIHRESIENTGIGNGLAIPHARSERVSSLITIFGISKEGIDYHSLDGKPAHFVSLSIFPAEESTKYLYYIGMLARIFSRKNPSEPFSPDMTPAKVHSRLQKEIKDYFSQIDDREKRQPEAASIVSGLPSTDLDLIIRLDRLYNLAASGEAGKAVEEKIAGIKKLIDSRSLRYYDRMKKKSDNPFAIVEKTSCSGCHMEFPPMVINTIREGKELTICPHCGRFLIIV